MFSNKFAGLLLAIAIISLIKFKQAAANPSEHANMVEFINSLAEKIHKESKVHNSEVNLIN